MGFTRSATLLEKHLRLFVFAKWLITYLLFYSILVFIKFWPLGITNNWYWNPTFPDLNSALRMMSCSDYFQHQIYKIDTPNSCGGYTYGYYLARVFALFNISESESNIVGLIFFSILILCASALSAYICLNWKISKWLLFFSFVWFV